MPKRELGGLVGRAVEKLEEVSGQTLVSAERLDLLEQTFDDHRILERQLEDIGWNVLNYMGRQPRDLAPANRMNIVQRARYVWMNDAQAGAAVELMNDFVFGRGVPPPRAKDKLVQEVLDEAWNSPDNQEVLTTLEAQLALGTDLALQPLDPDTEIRMADGSSKRLGDVQEGESVLTHTGERGRVAENIDAGVQPRFEMTTSEGRRVTGAGSHPFLTVHRGWCRLDELESGDELVREPRCEGLVAGVSGDEARLLGYFVGDGSCSSGNAGFTNADPAIIADFTAACERQGWRVTKEGYGPYTHGVSGGVRPWLRAHGVAGKTAHEKRVPVAVMRAPNWVAAEFLRGYFASDGCVSRDVFMATVSRGLADDVQHLLGRLGVRSSVLLNDAPSRKGKAIWTVRLRRESYATFLEEVDPLSEKGSRLAALVESLPARREIAVAGVGETACEVVGCGRTVAHVGLCEKHYAHQRRWGTTVTARSESVHDRVLAVAPVADGPVRCLSIDHDDHSYMANGIVTHNSNLFILMFDEGAGPPKLSILDHDTVTDIIEDPERRHRSLWYVARREAQAKYDFRRHQWQPQVTREDLLKPRYYQHWRNVDLLDEDDDRAEKPERPDDADIGEGRVFHVRINRYSEQKFGTPRFQRTLRWYSAYNQMVADRLSVISAAAQLIMKRKIKGGPDQLVRDAAKAISRRSPLAAAGDGVQAGLRPGSMIEENESVEHQAFNLDTRAANAQADAQMVRAPIAAAEGFSQAYFGDTSNSSLATATCHDDQTEALTSEGWMGLEELKRRNAEGRLPLVAAFDEGRDAIVYDAPKGGLLLYDYEGPMVRLWKSRTFDMLVTPNHRMLVKVEDGRGYSGLARRSWETMLASEVADDRRRLWSRVAAPIDGGTRVDEFVLPAHAAAGARVGARRGEYRTTQARNSEIRALASAWRVEPGTCECGCGRETPILDMNRPYGRRGEHAKRLSSHPGKGGRNRRIAELVGCSPRVVKGVLDDQNERRYASRRDHAHDKMRPEIRIPMDTFLRWLGWYIAEGSDGGVAQDSDSPWLEEVQEACRALGVEAIERFKPGRDGARIWNWWPRNRTQWTRWLDEHVGRGASNKRVPEFVFALPRGQQMEVLRGLMGGDGGTGGTTSWETTDSSYYATTSPGLADDVQRLALHCGFRARKKLVVRYQTKRGPRESWSVSLTASRSARDGFDHAVLPAATTESYSGEVWCFSMPQDTLVTRRNGVVAIQRQSLELPILKRVEGRKEVFERIFRWFIDRTIEKAVKDGRIPEQLDPAEVPERTVTPDSWDADTDQAGQLTAALQEAAREELNSGREVLEVAKIEGRAVGLTHGAEWLLVSRDAKGYHYKLVEAHEDKGADEQSTQRDLGYEFSLPSPLRRMMADLIAAITQIATTFDPNNSNPELARALLTIAFGEALEVQDAADLVETVLPKGYMDPVLKAQMEAAQAPPPPGPETSDGSEQMPGGADGNVYSAPMNARRPEQLRSRPYQAVEAVFEEGRYVGMFSRSRAGETIFWPARHRLELEEGLDQRDEPGAQQARHKVDEVGELFREDVIEDSLKRLDTAHLVNENGRK